MAAKAGRLQIQLELEVAALRRDLAAVNTQLQRNAADWKRSVDSFGQGFKDAFKFAGVAASLAAIGGAIKHTLDEMSRITDESVKIADTAENFQKLEFAANQVGVSMEDVTKSINRLQMELGQMRTGGAKGAAQALADIGLTLKDLEGLSPAEAFIKVSGALGEVDDHARLAADGAAIFSKGWQTTLPLMKLGEQGMRDLAAQAPIMSNAAVAAGDDFGDAMDKMKSAITALIAQGLAPVLPYLTAFATQATSAGDAAEDSGTQFDGMTTALQGIAQWVNGVVVVFKIAGEVLVTFGRTVGSVASAAIQLFGAIGDAQKMGLDPTTWFSDEARTGLLNRVKGIGAALSDTFADIRDDSAANLKAIFDQAARTRDALVNAGRPPPAATGTEAADAARAREQAAAEAEDAAKRQVAAAKAAADAAKRNAAEQAKIAKDAAQAIADQRQRLEDLSAAIAKEDAQKRTLTDAELELAAARRIANGESEQSVELWKLGEEHASAYEIAAAKVGQTTAELQAINERNAAATRALTEANIDLEVAMRLGRGESEESVRAWEDYARGLTATEIQLRNTRDATDAQRAATEESRRTAEQYGQMIGAGVADIFTAMTEGSEQAEQAVARLIQQLLTAIITAQVLKAFNIGTGTPQAKGGAWSQGYQLFAQGGIVAGPTAFSFAGGRMGVMGEAGPEAIMPLKRGVDGKLGVAGGASVQVFNYAGADVSVQQDEERLRIVVDRVRKTIAGDISRGGNSVASALERAYSVRR
jgi:hypothetical protein